MRIDATAHSIPEINPDLPDSGIVAPGDELLDNGLTVSEIRRRISAGLYRRRQVIAATATAVYQRLMAEEGMRA